MILHKGWAAQGIAADIVTKFKMHGIKMLSVEQVVKKMNAKFAEFCVKINILQWVGFVSNITTVTETIARISRHLLNRQTPTV